MLIPVFVINLKSSESRKERITGKLNSLGITYQIIDAIDGRVTDQNIKGKVLTEWKQGSRRRTLLKGEIGCVLSHFGIYEKMISEDIAIACILEDDAEPEDNFGDFLDSENVTKAGWDLLFLGHHSLCSRRETASIKTKNPKVSDRYIGDPLEIPVGSYGYLIKNRTAAEILKQGYPIRKPLDFYIGGASVHGISVKVLSPPCIRHNYTLESTIYHPSDIVFKASPVESIRRQVRKLYKYLPILQSLWVWLNFSINNVKIILRRTGLLKISFSDFN